MKIAIHNSPSGFHPRWISYCEENNIPWKKVNCYENDIIDQLSDCSALMWHFSHISPKDILIAKQLLFSLEQSGISVFPNFNTAWHFDDKVGQKYLLESIGAPLPNTYVFFSRQEAKSWAINTNFPKVFKLRNGAGSSNVKIVNRKSIALKLIKKAFRRGIKPFNAWAKLKERWRKFLIGKSNFGDVIKGVIRLVYSNKYIQTTGREKGYIYFQDYIPNNDHDIRVIVIGDKAFAIKRLVRKNDFRASGSGYVHYEKKNFRESTIELAFNMASKLNSQCIAFDFINDKEEPKVVEISFGFIKEVYDPCTGFWDRQLRWHDGSFNPYGWMVDMMTR